jgi:hypothetical protein
MHGRSKARSMTAGVSFFLAIRPTAVNIPKKNKPSMSPPFRKVDVSKNVAIVHEILIF